MESQTQPRLVACVRCGKVHYAITRAEAQRLVDDFNQYLETLSEAQRVNRYGPQRANVSSYERCRHCGAAAEVRPTKPEDGTAGETVGPILAKSSPITNYPI